MISQAEHMHSGKLNLHKITIVSISFLSFLGGIIVYISTQWGIGVSPDSVTYIDGARSLVAGYGFSMLGNNVLQTQPITHYPPFYSILLAIGGIFGLDPLVSAKFWNAVFFGGTIFLSGILLLSLCQNIKPIGYWISLIGSFLILTSVTMVEIHVMAWTEPLYIFLSLAVFILVAKYLSERKWFFLFGAAVFTSLAILTRFVGVSIVMAGAFGILLFGRFTFVKKAMAILVYGLISMGLISFWVIRNQGATGTGTNREIIFHAFSSTHIWEARDTLASWLLVPQTAPYFFRHIPFLLIAIATIVIFIYFGFKVGFKAEISRIMTGLFKIPIILKLFLLYIPCYLLILIISNTFLDTYTPLDGRILSPIYIPLLVLVLYAIAHLFKAFSSNYSFKFAIIVVGLLFATVYLYRSSVLIYNNYESGLGFNSQEWHYSETIAELNKLPQQIAIYSNVPEAIYIHTGRPAKKIPKEIKSINQLINKDFEAEWSSMQSNIDTGEGVVVYFDVPWRSLPQTEEELVELLHLRLLEQTSDGKIFMTNAVKD